MKVILKDNSIYSVGSWGSGKNRWVCQNIKTGENQFFEPGDILEAIYVSPAAVANLKY